MCWLPAISLVAVEFYARNFDGWGAWSTAPLFLLPLVLSITIAGTGAVKLFSEFRNRSVRASTMVAIAVALLPFLWLLVRRHVT
jgi:hypothetical protein